MAVRPVYALLDGVGIIDTDGLQDLSVTNPKLAPEAVDLSKVDNAVYGSAANPNTLVQRNASGVASIADPTSASHIATKGYVDGMFPVGFPELDSLIYGSANNPSTLVQRNSSGVFSISDPTSASHAATKGYVDAFFPVPAANISTVDGATIINGTVGTEELASESVTDGKTASNPPSGSSGNLFWTRFGGVAHLTVRGAGVNPSIMPDVSAGFRPTAIERAVAYQPGVTQTFIVEIRTDGTVAAHTVAAGGENFYFSISYEIGS